MKLISCAAACGVALGLAGCNKPLDYVAEGALEAPAACGYADAAEAGYRTAESYARTAQPTKDADPIAKAAFAELGYRKDAAERAKQQAKECEDRAREWSDLRAQWQNSRAAINIAYLADSQITLTVIEIVLLIMTVGGGLVSLKISRDAQANSEREKERQEGQFRRQLQSAYQGMADARRVAEQQTRAYVLPISGKFSWPLDGPAEFEITYRNAGQTPAINVSECILLSSDTRPPPADHSRVFAEGPIIGLGELVATTTIPPTLSDPLRRSRAIGKAIADGGDVWVYVYYQDVFGAQFRTGGRISCGVQFQPGVVDEVLSVHFVDEASGFFEELRSSASGPQMPSDIPIEPRLTPTMFRYNP